MDLLQKFAAVEVKADQRISERDKIFCQKHQEAYEKSGEALQKIAIMLEAMQKEQEDLLREPGDSGFYNPYTGGNDFDPDKIIRVIEGRSSIFIHKIIGYFEQTYHVDLDRDAIEENLLPKKPRFDWNSYNEKEMDQYHENLRSLSLRYEQIVDEIFTQLDGFSFQERAMNELLASCWKAAHRKSWNTGELEEEFEIKNSTLRLTGYWCSCSDESWRSHPEWRIHDDLRTVLKALSHYESGLMNDDARNFTPFFNYGVSVNEFEYPYLEKVEFIKLFKNGRVDIRFKSPVMVQEFVEKYLRVNVEA